MKRFAYFFHALAVVGAFCLPAGADEIPQEVIDRFDAADIVLLGEVHDNPDHHRNQALAVRLLKPTAMVWEMITEESALRLQSVSDRDPEELSRILRWVEYGWPEFSMYYPIFAAAPDAPVYGALVPREAAMSAMDAGAAVAFGAQAAAFGLGIPLAPEEQAAREADQLAAHCDSMPAEMLPVLVEIQRLRDAVLARAALTAFEDHGGPVVVITGNGHARLDRGVPEFIKRRAPGLRVVSLGQSEDGAITGEFDLVLDSPKAEREDPCKAFEKDHGQGAAAGTDQ